MEFPMLIQNRDAAEPFQTKDGSIIRSLLDRTNAPVQNQSLAEATVPPGRETTPHQHLRSEEFYYVIEGRGLMRIDEEEREVRVGDAILIPAGARHGLFNPGESPLRILCCCAPPYDHEDTVLEEE
jgi:mannose-6-phosphate isomerase-like protein (cupin superfamily)